jgi:hypothetical protein
MLLEIPERPHLVGILPVFTDKDVAILKAMGISLDLSRDFKAQS